MEFMSKQIDLNGNMFHYRECWHPHAPVIVALHSLGNNSESWDQVATHLGKKFRFIALDLRGHGNSVRTDTYSFEEMSEDLLLFVDRLQLERFILLGHSMGGTVSYLFAQKDPSRLEKLIIVDTPPPYPDKHKEIPPEPKEPLPFDWNVFVSIMGQLNKPDPEWWGKLPTISTKTLLIGGSASNIPQDKLQEVSAIIPSCKFVSIEGAHHHVHRDKLAEFLQVVQQFLNE